MSGDIESNKKIDPFKSQQRISIMTIVSDLPNTIISAVISLLSGSVIMALDAFESFANVVQGTLTYRLSKKMQGDASFKYDYGMGKIDSFGSLVSSTILFLGLAAILAGSVNSLINPSSPSGFLFFAIIIKSINATLDGYLVYKQSKIVKISNSPLVKSTMIYLKKDFLTDIVVLVTVVVAFIFRAYPVIMYFEPVVCILCVIYVAVINTKHVRRATSDLLDKTLDENTQLQIISCVTKVWDNIDDFKGVRTRRSGTTTFIDLMVSFNDEQKYNDILQVYDEFEAAVKEVLPDSDVSIVISREQQTA